MNTPRRLGLLGGAFDPPHWGHVGAAIEVAYQLSLDAVLLVPAGVPPHKRPVAPPEARLEMVALAALEHPSLEASRLELTRPGPHYTVDTLRTLRALEPEATLHLILGTDAAASLGTWREPAAITELATVVVVERAGWTSLALESALTSDRAEGGYDEGASADPRRAVRWPGVAVSSSEIRRRVAAGAPIEYLVPRSVGDYLHRHRLYR